MELIHRAIEDARRRGGFDAITLMGDLIDDGDVPHADKSLEAIRELLDRIATDVPLLILPGNHDSDTRRLQSIFRQRTGIHEIGGYRFVTFADHYDADDVCTRSSGDRDMLKALTREDGGPIITLQHNPIHPPIDNEYPYTLANRDVVLHDYEQAGVALSLSAHYHWGQPVNVHRGITFFTCPALCEAPFHYVLVTLTGRNAQIETRSLAIADDEPALWDSHTHTELAYCCQNVSAEAVLARADELNLAGVCITEHAPQLYCGSDGFWNGRHINDPAMWRDATHRRIEQYWRLVEPLRGPRVRVGLEVEADVNGDLTLLDDDRAKADVLIGAVHWLPGEPESMDDAAVVRAFVSTTEALLAGGVDVLAHPLRWLRSHRRAIPKSLHGELAELLAETNTAAEINFHVSHPDPAFLAACIDRGVRIALGSDCHALYEAAGLRAHLALLREVIGDNADLRAHLWQPPAL